METKQTGEFEFKGGSLNGFLMIFIDLLLWGAVVLFTITAIQQEQAAVGALAAIIGVVAIICSCGFSMLEPNEAKVMTFFGKYVGTFRKNGFFWLNPFMSVKNVSLRARNLNAEPIKVNDKAGNPVLIGLVVVWRLKDTYKAITSVQQKINNYVVSY